MRLEVDLVVIKSGRSVDVVAIISSSVHAILVVLHETVESVRMVPWCNSDSTDDQVCAVIVRIRPQDNGQLSLDVAYSQARLTIKRDDGKCTSNTISSPWARAASPRVSESAALFIPARRGIFTEPRSLMNV